MEKSMMYTGIDLHKQTCYLVTVDADGNIVRERQLRNNPQLIRDYFGELAGDHQAVVESTSGWYWLGDLLREEGVPLKLAHAKNLKAIAYAKVKTDKVDATTLAQLLRVDLIPEAHQISSQLRELRDMLRTRLTLVQKKTSVWNSIRRIEEKHNASIDDLSQVYRLQVDCHLEQIELLESQIKTLEKYLAKRLRDSEQIRLLRTVPGVGSINAFTIHLEMDGVDRFPSQRHFHSYCRLVPGSADTGPRQRHKKSKDGNSYLRLAFAHAAIRAIQNYKEIKQYYVRLARRKHAAIARTLVAKQIATIAYCVLRDKQPFNGRFKNLDLTLIKGLDNGHIRQARCGSW
jgi:transposase